MNENNLIELAKNDPILGSDSEDKDHHPLFKGEISDEKKEKLRIRLLNESQTYYQNNLNIFCNGLSLLTVNTLEAHG